MILANHTEEEEREQEERSQIEIGMVDTNGELPEYESTYSLLLCINFVLFQGERDLTVNLSSVLK